MSGDINGAVKDDDKNDVFIPAKFKSKSPKKFEGNKLIFEQIPSPWLSPDEDTNWEGMDRRKDHVGPRIENIEHVNKTVENGATGRSSSSNCFHNLMVRFVDQNEFMTRVTDFSCY